MDSYAKLRADAEAYYRLCDRAAAVGIPVSLDDSRSPQTVAELERQTVESERRS